MKPRPAGDEDASAIERGCEVGADHVRRAVPARCSLAWIRDAGDMPVQVARALSAVPGRETSGARRAKPRIHGSRRAQAPGSTRNEVGIPDEALLHGDRG